MKKKILGGIAVLAIAAIAAFNVNINTQEDALSAISMDNVEALASESGGTKCYNTITTKEGHQVRYCGTCKYTSGVASWNSGTDSCN